MLGSSTPDGLAPLSGLGTVALVGAAGGLALLWSAFNLIHVLRRQPLEDEATSSGYYVNRLLAITEMVSKINHSGNAFIKFAAPVCIGAILLFFVMIMGLVQNFASFSLSLCFLMGGVFSLLTATLFALMHPSIYTRVCAACNHSLQEGFDLIKHFANFVSFFASGLTLLLLLAVSLLTKTTLVNQMGDSLLCFGFGVGTVGVVWKITSAVYAKGVEGGMSDDGGMRRDAKHPSMICKGAGDLLTKFVSHILDQVLYQCACTGVAVASAVNVVGADQNGEIIFEPNANNLFLPLLTPAFCLIISIVMSVVSFLGLKPASGDDTAVIFKRECVVTAILLTGFLALSSYLCLPAEYVLLDKGKEVCSPLLAYAIQMLGVAVALGLSLLTELQFNHPRVLYSQLDSCAAGAATAIISGMAFGFFCTVGPVVITAVSAFLSYFWLGEYGVALLGVGLTVLSPQWMNMNAFFTTAETASMVGCMNQIGDDPVSHLLALAQGRRVNEPQQQSVFHLQALSFVYASALVFSKEATIASTINAPTVFAGLLLGTMLASSFAALLIKSVHNLLPLVGYEVREQLAEGNADTLDHQRVDHLLALNSVLQIKSFLPSLLAPCLLIGMALGPQVMLGALTGLGLSAMQLSLSASSSGFIWNSIRTEIVLGRIKAEEDRPIPPDGTHAQSAEVTNDVGLRINGTVGTALHVYATFISLLSLVFASFYSSIHS